MPRKTKRRSRRRVPWAGWGKISPKGRQRTRMLKKCGSKCFLGKRGTKSFPVCAVYGNKISCEPNDKGLWAAYIRAREWGKARRTYKGKARPRYQRRTYTRVARRARDMLRDRGQYVGRGGGGDIGAPVKGLPLNGKTVDLGDSPLGVPTLLSSAIDTGQI